MTYVQLPSLTYEASVTDAGYGLEAFDRPLNVLYC